MQKVQARHLFRFADILGDLHLIAKSANASPECCIVLLSLKEIPDYRTTSNTLATSAKRRSDSVNHFRVHIWKDGVVSVSDLEPTKQNYHSIESLGDGKFILTCHRAVAGRDNGFIYDANGQVISSLFLGDGIEDVQSTPDGQTIWVSYFDEGVFGDSDMGQEGLVALKQDGTLVHRFATALRNENPLNVPDICDCYALNVATDKDTFLYYYTDFPLVRITERVVTGIWRDLKSKGGREIQGSHAFAVNSERALFGGGYSVNDRLHLYSLNGYNVPQESVVPVDANQDRISISDASFARGGHFFIVRGDDLFVLSLDTPRNKA
jgi:hypothetical protein